MKISVKVVLLESLSLYRKKLVPLQKYYSPMLEQIHFATFTIVNFFAFPLRSAVKVCAYRELIYKDEEAVVV